VLGLTLHITRRRATDADVSLPAQRRLPLPVSVFARATTSLLRDQCESKRPASQVSVCVFIGVYLHRVQVGQRLLDKGVVYCDDRASR
jgi:hypothetical protein